ncbi:uncharacterized protein [Ptychodera flava]|uniref:uncharacterized protein n=1 Tax=Ptychodera flava TaxID=63121 RepID=UPI00396A3C6C
MCTCVQRSVQKHSHTLNTYHLRKRPESIGVHSRVVVQESISNSQQNGTSPKVQPTPAKRSREKISRSSRQKGHGKYTVASPKPRLTTAKQSQRVQTPLKTVDTSMAKGTASKKLCREINYALRLPDAAKKKKKISDVLKKNAKTQFSVPVDNGHVNFIAHPGFDQTLEDIELQFETDYVDEDLFMVGYLDYCGSDNFVMVGEDGKVYQAEDEILYVVKEDLYRYLTEGPTNLGYYDFYRHLGSEGSLECIGWKEDL